MELYSLQISISVSTITVEWVRRFDLSVPVDSIEWWFECPLLLRRLINDDSGTYPAEI